MGRLKSPYDPSLPFINAGLRTGCEFCGRGSTQPQSATSDCFHARTTLHVVCITVSLPIGIAYSVEFQSKGCFSKNASLTCQLGQEGVGSITFGRHVSNQSKTIYSDPDVESYRLVYI
jgi:hypothetical protein